MSQKVYAEKIKESAEELYALERKARQVIVRDRLRFLRLLKNGTAANPLIAGAHVNYRKAWSYQLWQRYEQNGIRSLSDYPFKGTKPRIDASQQQQFRAALLPRTASLPWHRRLPSSKSRPASVTQQVACAT